MDDPAWNNVLSKYLQMRSVPSRPSRPSQQQTYHKPVNHGNKNKLQMAKIDSYTVPDDINALESDNFKPSLMNQLKKWSEKKSIARKDEAEYLEAHKMMIYLEEAAETKFIEKFNMLAIRFFWSEEANLFYFEINDETHTISAAVDENLVDSFVMKSTTPHDTTEIHGKIDRKGWKKIFVRIKYKTEVFKQLCEQHAYNVNFELNRLPYQLQHYALHFMEEHNLFSLLIDNPKYDEVDDDFIGFGKEEQSNIEFTDLFTELNAEQKSAVESIVSARNFPLPYIVFGPPGTGKTRTLVAAIEQIVRTTNKNVLVCAMSNSACDEIAERLAKVISPNQMYRLYAKTFDQRKMQNNLQTVSNWSQDGFNLPPLDDIYEYRVVICTLYTSGCITRANESVGFDPRHFSYVIIDECASAHETMTLIPIAGLCSTENEIHASIVLVGDPKQLDAMTKSNWAKDLGHKTSLLEHLCERNLYKRDPRTNEFRKAYITQLVENYRSHPLILQMSNELFYDNKLKAKAKKEITDWYINSNFLPSKNFPIIFRNVQGFCKRSGSDFSLFNEKEVDVVIEYVQQLLRCGHQLNRAESLKQSDIGIVSPYKKQCKKIGLACRDNDWTDITIGTAEAFQGKEKAVMIVSTVRSGGQRLGFVNDPRRLNVIITRAKCLLIIVGDQKTLQLDPNWERILKFCQDNKSFVSKQIRQYQPAPVQNNFVAKHKRISYP